MTNDSIAPFPTDSLAIDSITIDTIVMDSLATDSIKNTVRQEIVQETKDRKF